MTSIMQVFQIINTMAIAMGGRTSYQSLIAIASIEPLTHFISLSPQFETSFILIRNHQSNIVYCKENKNSKNL